MKHTSKKWLGLLLALVLLCSLLPVSALAEEPGETPEEPQEPTAYNLWIGGVQVTDETLSGEGWSYDAASKTLTLTDANITGEFSNCSIRAQDMDLTVELVGKNSLSHMIFVDNGKLKIQGEGSLSSTGSTFGIDVRGGSLSISGGCTVTATGSSYGINATGDISVQDSTVTAEGPYGIYTEGKLEIKDSTVKVTGTGFYGCFVNGKLSIAGNSSLSAEAINCAVYYSELSIGEGLGITEPAGGVNNGHWVALDGAKAAKVVIEPVPTYRVSVKVEPEGAGTASADPSSGAAGTEITLTATPNEGYSFLEWQVVTGNVTVENDKFTLGTENVELKAAFEPITYTVKFDPNGGDGQMDDAIVNYGDKLILPDCGFTPPAGMEFDKWDKGAPGDEIEVDGDMTVTAQWKEPEPPAAYTVKFDPNGGGGQMDDASVNVGDKLTLPECGFTPPLGKVFDKWDKGAPGEEIEVDGDMTVTAQWKSAVYTVTFDSKGGSEVPEQFVEYGGKATEPDEPTRSGFNFDTWYSDSACTQIFDFNTPITGDITLYAKWAQKVKYTVVSGGGKVYGKASGEELVITVKRNPKDNECFKHFSNVQIDGKTLTKDTDYTAEAGSTVITLKPEYLSKLNTGRHIITINFDDGKATTGMTVKAGTGGGGGRRGGGGDNPDTGDLSNPGLWTGVLLLSGLALGGVIVTGRKARRAER